jgi:hypothetical protein
MPVACWPATVTDSGWAVWLELVQALMAVSADEAGAVAY